MSTATLQRVIETLPLQGLDFEYCSVKQQEVKTITVSNPTNNLVSFEIVTTDNEEAAQLFSIEPKQGKL